MESRNVKKKAAPQMASEEKRKNMIMLKWMLGCSRCVKMVFRNAEIKDAPPDEMIPQGAPECNNCVPKCQKEGTELSK